MSDYSEPENLQGRKNLVEQNPLDPAAWVNLGYFYLDAGEQLEAQKCFLKVLELDPGNLEAQVNLDRINLVDKPIKSKQKPIKLGILEWTETEIPIWLQLVIGLFSFLMIFILARIENWTAANMMWSLWITSLTIGYCYLFAGIISSTLRSQTIAVGGLINRLFQVSIPSGIKFAFVFISIVFQLAFFTLHFGFFHFVFSVFLNDLFPIIDRPFERFSDFLFFIGISLKAYWPVILFVGLASMRKFQRILSQREVDYVKSAYINIIKIFVSIFLFTGFSFTRIQAWVLPVIFIIYFFPLSAVLEFLKNFKKKPVLTKND